MDLIFEAIEEWMRNLLTGTVSSNPTTMQMSMKKTGHLRQAGQDTAGLEWRIYSMIQNLPEFVNTDCRYDHQAFAILL